MEGGWVQEKGENQVERVECDEEQCGGATRWRRRKRECEVRRMMERFFLHTWVNCCHTLDTAV